MKKINNESLDQNIQRYTDFFKEDLDAIDEELVKSKEYSELIDKEIENLKEMTSGLGVSKGGQHYLIQHMTNAVSLQTQRQNLRKDRFAIKKVIIDLANKFSEDDDSENSTATNLSVLIEELLAKDRENDKKDSHHTKTQNDENLDDEIDNILSEN